MIWAVEPGQVIECGLPIVASVEQEADELPEQAQHLAVIGPEDPARGLGDRVVSGVAYQ
ncbi:hypothetical protein [Streptosporangium sp. CA-115845]|uniref:hypothetical protein n=1 Tax=Streptosporangium sp. CA-115845 TaxID=3240071 RepID=UPI003D8CFB0B